MFFVVDTDKIQDCDIFESNLNILKSYKYIVYLIIQNKNLEDELCFSCSKDMNSLLKGFYSLKSKTEFKAKIAKEKILLKN